MQRLSFLIGTLVAGRSFALGSDGFYAYNTKIDTGEPWDRFGIPLKMRLSGAAEQFQI